MSHLITSSPKMMPLPLPRCFLILDRYQLVTLGVTCAVIIIRDELLFCVYIFCLCSFSPHFFDNFFSAMQDGHCCCSAVILAFICSSLHHYCLYW